MPDFPDVAVVAFEQAPNVRATHGTTNGVEMLVPVFERLYAATGLAKEDVGFWCSGSSDYLAGRPFSFIAAVDAIGAWPPINESHVEADAAWALFEAWVKIRTGEVETALVYGFGKSSAGALPHVLALQLDPYLVAPLWPDAVSIAGLQARAGLDSGRWTERQMAEVAVRSRTDALSNPDAQLSGEYTVDGLLAEPYLADPLRAHDCAPVTDGAAAIVLASANVAADLCANPAWIAGIEHVVGTATLSADGLSTAPEVAAMAGRIGTDGVGVAELHAPFTHQELLLRNEIGLPDDARVNPSGGVLCGNPMYAAGLTTIGHAARRVHDGTTERALAHATNGPALQQNLLCLLEGR